MNKQIKIIVVDDHEVFRYGLRRMLEQEMDMEVVADYANADEAISHIQDISPDIVLIDTHMPHMNGIEATWRLKRNGERYEGDVILLADSDSYYIKAFRAGADGYLINKDVTCAKLVQTIRNVYEKRQSSEGATEEVVRLVISPGIHIGQLLRCTSQLELILNENSNHGCIVSVAGTCNKGVVITVSLGRMSTLEFLHKLNSVPIVEKVEEPELSKSVTSTHARKVQFPRLLAADRGTTIHVAFREPIAAVQEPVMALN